MINLLLLACHHWLRDTGHGLRWQTQSQQHTDAIAAQETSIAAAASAVWISSKMKIAESLASNSTGKKLVWHNKTKALQSQYPKL